MNVERALGRITKIEEINEEIKQYEISFERASEAAFCFAVSLGCSESEIFRSYTPTRIDKGSVVCPIKIYKQEEGKKMFTPLLNTRREEDVVDVVWYRRKFPVEDILSERVKTVFMVSAGTGVAPMMQLLFYSELQKMRQLKFISVCFNRDHTYTILRNKADYPTLDVSLINVFTREEESSRDAGLAVLRTEVEKTDTETTAFLVCGPDSFVETVAGTRKREFGGILKDMGAREESCYKF